MGRPILVAIDGPAGAGKSTVARALAARLGFTLVDTGAIYRAVALEARARGVAWTDEAALEAVVAELELSFRLDGEVNRVFLGGREVTEAIRTPEMSMGASRVSRLPGVRDGLLALQRRLAQEAGTAGAVLEGRDIGTVVFPDADFKFFLDARPEERARRRWAELSDRGDATSLEEVLADQERRDAQDREREVAPLKPAEDAVVVDSTALGFEAVVETLADRIERRVDGDSTPSGA